MQDPPVYEVTPEEVHEFRSILEKQIGRALEHSDAEVEEMIRNAVGLVWTLREVVRRRSHRQRFLNN